MILCIKEVLKIMSLETILLFIPVGLIAIAAPGQDFVFIVGVHEQTFCT